MFRYLRQLWHLLFWGNQGSDIRIKQNKKQNHNFDMAGTTTVLNVDNAIVGVETYDEALFERSKMQWEFGDWRRLSQLSRENMQHHPDRAKLSLLAAAGHSQLGDNEAAAKFIRLAIDWGCSKAVVIQILIAGVHNSLGRAAIFAEQEDKAQSHFQNAILIGSPRCDPQLMAQARTSEQIRQLRSAAECTAR